jgi:hypothetical protein
MLRNYLISFAIIALVLLAIHMVNRWAEQRPTEPVRSAEQAPAPRR